MHPPRRAHPPQPGGVASNLELGAVADVLADLGEHAPHACERGDVRRHPELGAILGLPARLLDGLRDAGEGALGASRRFLGGIAGLADHGGEAADLADGLFYARPQGLEVRVCDDAVAFEFGHGFSPLSTKRRPRGAPMGKEKAGVLAPAQCF